MSGAGERATPRPNFSTDSLDPSMEWRRLLTEALGAFFLTLAAAAPAVISVATGQKIGQPAAVVAPGLVVMALIYTVGDVSGAHFNPTVTLAFAIRDDFPWRRVPGYMLAQFVGGIVAAGLLRALFGNVGHLGATLPNPATGDLASLVMECVLTFLLVTVILGTAHDTKLAGHNAALAVGATIALDGLFASPVSGASMNPARSFGPALVSGDLGSVWIYFVGPLAGALLATLIAWALHGETTDTARRTAGGR
ncbi:MAG TPA: aquaporin [Ktedonobacterales bacterium]|nr:aquaporin [Ktedonobacterales bacterium]